MTASSLDQYSRRERYAGNRLSYHKRLGTYQLYLFRHVFLQTDHALRMRRESEVNYRGGYAKFNMKENFPDIGGRKIVAYFDFDPKMSDELEVKVALSGVSTEGALKNLRAEASGADFDQLAAKASDTWNKALSVIDAKGSDDQLAMLYTSLYHTMINPCVYTTLTSIPRTRP